jgi:TonB family protein
VLDVLHDHPNRRRIHAGTLVLSIAFHAAAITLWMSQPQHPHAVQLVRTVYAAHETVWYPANAPMEKPQETVEIPDKIPATKPARRVLATPSMELKPTNVPSEFRKQLLPDPQGSIGVAAPLHRASSLLPTNEVDEIPVPPSPGSRAADGVNGDARDAKPPLRISHLEPAVLLRQTLPVYPELALRNRIQGTVNLEATIDENGVLRDIRAVSGHPVLIPAAIDCVKKWRYRPTVLNGQRIAAPAVIQVNFRLDFHTR